MDKLIIIFVFVVLIRAITYSVRCFKEKNISGGISVLFLAFTSVFASYYLLQI